MSDLDTQIARTLDELLNNGPAVIERMMAEGRAPKSLDDFTPLLPVDQWEDEE